MNFNSISESQYSAQMINTLLKMAAVTLVMVWCFNILEPFLLPIFWGAILAVAVYPLFCRLVNKLNGKRKLASIIFSVVGITILVVPTVFFSGSAIESIQTISTELQNGTLSIPAPEESVKTWPFIGEQLYPAWQSAHENIKGFVSQYPDQIKATFSQLLSAAASFGGVIIEFIVAVVIAAVFMNKADICQHACHKILNKFMGEYTEKSLETSVATIRSVAQGILGIAFTQSILAGVGLVITDIPAAGIWVLLTLIVCILQLPPLLVLGPVSAYYFTVADPTPAVIYLIYNMIVAISDAFLKPLMLGRGLEIPMLVILLGAIGGMILSGIIGLFIGAIVLALGYQMVTIWSGLDEYKIQKQIKN